MLQAMFSDSQRPLYRLCRVIELERIHASDYAIFIQKKEKRWKIKLEESVVQRVCDLTECHAFYMNALCNELWLDDQAPLRLIMLKKRGLLMFRT